MLVALAFFPLAIVAFWYLHWWRYSWRLRGIPGPRPLPIVGNALLFPDSASVLPELTKLVSEYGSIIKVIIGIEPSITTTDYHLLEAILSSSKLIDKAPQYRHLTNWLGFGLLTSGGAKWKQRRKIITPTYHFQVLEQFVTIFDTVGDVLIEELKVNLGYSFDIYPYVTLCTLDIICETAMGTSVNAQKNKNCDYVLCVKEMCKILIDRVFSPLQQFNFTYRFTANYRKEMRCLKVLNDYTMSVIRSRRLELQNSKQEAHDDFGTKKKVAFLDLLLGTRVDGAALSDEDIREEVATFMFEGHDTTASAISFALFLIANHPEVEGRLVAEQRAVFGEDRGRRLQHRDLQDMRYLEMVIKETLRLYPSVPFYARQVLEDTKINDDLTFPAGLTVNIFAYGIQRDPRYYPEPESFIPERFSPEFSLGKHPYSFIPFSAGSRNCIGQKFALLEMKATISKVLRHFALSPAVPEHRLSLISETILKSSNGVRLTLGERDW